MSAQKTVEELNLQNLTDEEAIRLLELANEEVYDTDDVPERRRTLFEKMEQELRGTRNCADVDGTHI
jgi:hypothetical protein